MNLIKRFHVLNVATWTLVMYVFQVGVLRSPRFAGDTVAMTQSAQLLVNCARAGKFLGCPGANQYGVLQNIPALFLVWKGLTLEGTVAVIGFLNIVAYCTLIMLLWRTFRGPLRNVAVLAFLAGPLVGYVSLTFGEMLQSLVFVAFVISVARRRWMWVIVTGVLASSTRETAFLPLALIAAGLLVSSWLDGKTDRRRAVISCSAGISGGVFLLTLFNYWKFGTWRNLGNLNSLYVTPGVLRKLDSGIAIWFAPGGGVFPFWFLGGLLSLGLLLFVLLRGTRTQKVSALFLGAGLGVNTASLAMWFAPFGWVAWGPRLMIPTIACVIVGNLLVFDDVIIPNGTASQTIRAIVGLTVAGLATVSALPSLGYMRSPGVIDRFFAPDAVCNKVAIIQEDPAYYFMCLHHGAWKTSPSLWSTGLDGISGWELAAAGVLFVALFVAALSLASGTGTKIEDLDETRLVEDNRVS